MTSRRLFIGIGVLVIVAAAVVVYSVLRTPEEASSPIEAIPIAATERESEETSLLEETPQIEATEVAVSPSEGPILFEISQDESEVRFLIGEILRGRSNLVVGVSNQVAGEISIDPLNPQQSTVGTILINARTFVTDNSSRNRAISNLILDTGDHEFITFTPTSIQGLPESASIGDTLEFEITGVLAVRDVENEVVFDLTVTAVSETRLEGFATSVIRRADYSLTIPKVPQVAEVDQEIQIEIDFVALPSS